MTATGQFPKRRESDAQAKKRIARLRIATSSPNGPVPIDERKNRDLSRHEGLPR